MRRRIFAALLSLCLVLGLLPTAALAQDTVNYVALGDSITTGYGLGDAPSFAEIVAEKQGYTLNDRLAADGTTSAELPILVEMGREAIVSADLITITIGGNDLMEALYQYLTAQYNTAHPDAAITEQDLQEKLMAGDFTLLTFAAGVIGGFANSENATEALTRVEENLTTAVTEIKQLNQDARIIVANQYNPYSKIDNSMFSSVVEAFEAGVDALNQSISSTGYEVADVYTAFDTAEQNPCNASVTAEFPPSINLDFHPNAYGHELIADVILDLLEGWTPPEDESPGTGDPAPAVDSLYVNGEDLLAAANYTVACGDNGGTAVYNPQTNTLTLTDAEITETYFDGYIYSGIYASGNLNIVLAGGNSITISETLSYGMDVRGSLDIVLTGENTITVSGDASCGIDTASDLSIRSTDNGSLKIVSENIGIHHAGSNLSITDCALTIDADGNGTTFGTSLTGVKTTHITGSTVTIESSQGTAVSNSQILITDSTVYATSGGPAILALSDVTITDSTVTACCTATNSVSSYYTGLRSFYSLDISGNSIVTATAQSQDGKISCGVFGRFVTLGQGVTLIAEGEQAAVRANSGITLPDGYLPQGYSVRTVSNTLSEDDFLYTIAEDGAELTYTHQYVPGGNSTDILTGAATSVTLREPVPVPEPDPIPSSPSNDDDSYDSSSSSTTETVRNPDGSTTTTVTRPNGTTIETTRSTDGSKEVVETRKDGTVITTDTDTEGNEIRTTENPDGTSAVSITRTDGSTSATTVDETGLSVTVVTLPGNAVAQSQTEVVPLPMPSVSAAPDLEDAPTVTLNLPTDGSVWAEIPVEDMTAGTVAVLVRDDGTSEIVKTSVVTEDGVVLALSAGDTVKIMDNTKTFFDVADTFWGAEAVTFVTSRELFQGVTAVTFDPSSPMNRAMIVTVLARLDGVDTTAGSTWYEAGAQWAVTSGISDGSNLHQDLTREQLAVMLYRYARYKGLDVSVGENTNILSYPDFDAISEYAIEAFQWACGAGIISGKDGHLDPGGNATRAEVATVLMRFCQQL